MKLQGRQKWMNASLVNSVGYWRRVLFRRPCFSLFTIDLRIHCLGPCTLFEIIVDVVGEYYLLFGACLFLRLF